MGWPLAIDVYGLSADVDDDGVIRIGNVRLSGPSGCLMLREPGVHEALAAHIRLAGEARARWIQVDAIELAGTRFETVVAFVAAGHGDIVTTVADAVRREIEVRLPRSGVHPRESANGRASGSR